MVQNVLFTARVADRARNLIVAHVRVLHLHQQHLDCMWRRFSKLEYLQYYTGQCYKHVSLARSAYLLYNAIRYPRR